MKPLTLTHRVRPPTPPSTSRFNGMAWHGMAWHRDNFRYFLFIKPLNITAFIEIFLFYEILVQYCTVYAWSECIKLMRRVWDSLYYWQLTWRLESRLYCTPHFLSVRSRTNVQMSWQFVDSRTPRILDTGVDIDTAIQRLCLLLIKRIGDSRVVDAKTIRWSGVHSPNFRDNLAKNLPKV